MPLKTKSKKNNNSFFSFNLTTETLYWSIFLAIAILFTIWISHIETQIQILLDQTTEINNSISTVIKK